VTTRLRLADLAAAERLRVAVSFHEAGHAIENVLLGGRIHAAAVGDGGDGRASGPLGATVHAQVPEGTWARGRSPRPA
jgi:hypothetical protein